MDGERIGRTGVGWIIGVAACLLLAVAPAATAPPGLPEVAGGQLLVQRDGAYVPLPVGAIDVDLQVTGGVLQGRLTQTFRNDLDATIEAVYVFPLPDRAAVRHMELRIGERRIVAEIREREAARRVYDRARETGHKAALLDQERPNLFTTSAANIDPGETIDVTLEYVEPLDWVDGAFRLRFPLTFTPRFDLGGAAGDPARSRPDGRRAEVPPAATIRVAIAGSAGLERVESDSHDVRVGAENGTLRVEPSAGPVPADRDFVLAWRPRLGAVTQSTVFVEERDDGRYAMLLLVPPAPGSDAARGLPTETLFVLDVSGSMAGPSIRQARQALLQALERLRPDDRFNILVFNQSQRAWSDRFRFADGASLAAARGWVGSLEAGGGTAIADALGRAIDLLGSARGTRRQRLVFLTDGAVANEEAVVALIGERLGDARLHAIGIGHAPNTWLLRKMAELGRGLCEYVADVERAPTKIAAFFERLERPVLTDLTLDWTGVELTDVLPARLPDLHAGQPLTLYARIAGDASGTVRVEGLADDGLQRISARVDAVAPRGTGLAFLWARRRVEDRLDELREGADPAAVRAEVIELALRHRIVSPYTSLVAVEQAPRALAVAGTSVRTAGALPRGATARPLRRRIGVALLAAGLWLWIARRIKRC